MSLTNIIRRMILFTIPKVLFMRLFAGSVSGQVYNLEISVGVAATSLLDIVYLINYLYRAGAPPECFYGIIN